MRLMVAVMHWMHDALNDESASSNSVEIASNESDDYKVSLVSVGE